MSPESTSNPTGEMRERWTRAAAGWREHADDVRAFGMPASARMIERLSLQPGQRVLELAAGPGDTGFLAAELLLPGGVLISSDAVEAMLAIARERAIAMGIGNVEFRLLQLEWIDLETASVDAVLCRWGLMFASDPSAALHEMRRVTKPGGRVAVAVWDAPEQNPWATIPSQALIELGHLEPPDPKAPGMFVLGDRDRLRRLFEEAGFVEVAVDAVELTRSNDGIAAYAQESLEMSRPVAEVRERLSDAQWAEVCERIEELAAPFAEPDGAVRFPALTLVASADA